MQAPNIYPFSQTQPQALPGFTYGPPQLVFDHSAPRVDPLHSTVTIISVPSAHIILAPTKALEAYNLHSKDTL